jgi:M6 family metalloprotease-like protein
MKKQPLIIISAIFIAIMALFAGVRQASASPAAPLPVSLTQPDGTTIAALPWGDEWSNGFETIDGYTILQDPASGWWIYAGQQTDGILAPAHSAGRSLRVGFDSPQGLAQHLRPEGASNPLLTREQSIHATDTDPEFNLPPAKGDMKVLVLLAKFPDQIESYPAAAFEELVFGESDSLKSFYQEVSYGELNLIPAEESCGLSTNDGIADWRELPYAHPNTGENTGEDNLVLVKDILTANDDCIDYASFDLDHDGGLSADELQIVVVVAGWEYAYGDHHSPSIWAHSFYLDFIGLPLLDGVEIGGYYRQSYYAQIGEIHGIDVEQHPATLGVLAHEFGHLLNWPDLYDVDNSSEGVGRWSIMGSGSWNQSGAWAGDTPAHPDAWSKWYQGWLSPLEIQGDASDLLISQAEDSPQAYLLRPNPNGIDWTFNYHTGRGEYFLVENRQQTGFDAGLPGCGLLVWHVNEQTTFSNYANASDSAPLVSLVQADGLDDLLNHNNRGDAGDPYPGLTGNQLLNHDSIPDSRRYGGSVSGVSMTVDSTGCAPVMQADLSYFLYQNIFTMIHADDTACWEWETILKEDFEDGSLENWSLVDKTGVEDGEYYPAISSCRADQSARSVWLIGGGSDGSALGCGSHYPDRAIPWMIHGPFSTIGATDMRLDFSHWTYVEPAIPYLIYDRFCVWASENNQIYIGYCFTGDWGGWSTYSFSLKDDVNGYYDFLNKPQVWVAFSMMSDDYVHFPEGAYVDNIVLRNCLLPVGCEKVPSPSATGAEISSVTNPFGTFFPPSRPLVIGPITVTLPEN